ncbi:MAG: hypothetical protein LBU32_31905 [Clostridiales bacterium]|nr:hypothetical protein [Clostridiales bacterium]
MRRKKRIFSRDGRQNAPSGASGAAATGIPGASGSKAGAALAPFSKIAAGAEGSAFTADALNAQAEIAKCIIEAKLCAGGKSGCWSDILRYILLCTR